MAGSFDPSVIGSIADSQANPQKAQQDAYTLYDSKNRVQMNALTLQQAKEDQADKAAVKKILQSSGDKLSTDAGVNEVSEQIAKVSPDLAMKFKQDTNTAKQQNLDTKLKEIQVAQEQQLPLLNSIDKVIRDLQPYKTRFEQGKMTESELNALTVAKIMPEAQQLMKDNPNLAPYIQKYFADPKNLSYNRLVSLENQSKQGRDMYKQQEQEIRDAQRQQGLDTANLRMEGYLSSIANQNKNRDQRTADKKASLLDKDTLHDMATQYVKMGDRTVFQNMGRGEAAGQNWVALRKMARQVMLELGYTPEQISAKVAEFNGIQAEFRALGTREAQVRTASAEFHHVETDADGNPKLDKNGKEIETGVAQLARKASEELPRRQWVHANEIAQTYQKYNSNSKFYRLGQAIDTTINVYARAIAPTGVPPEAARKRALDKLSTAMDDESFQAVLDFMQSEVDQAQISPQKVRDDIMREITEKSKGANGATPRPGQQTSGTPAKQAATSAAASTKKSDVSDDDLVKLYTPQAK